MILWVRNEEHDLQTFMVVIDVLNGDFSIKLWHLPILSHITVSIHRHSARLLPCASLKSHSITSYSDIESAARFFSFSLQFLLSFHSSV